LLISTFLRMLQPQSPEEVTVECWYMDSTDEDQRKPHRQKPNVPGSPETLKSIGVLSWKLDADKYQDDPKLEAIRKVNESSSLVKLL
jgi:1,2-dihydroxy-3-keto-5-methylthiopentene dioxygenase